VKFKLGRDMLLYLVCRNRKSAFWQKFRNFAEIKRSKSKGKEGRSDFHPDECFPFYYPQEYLRSRHRNLVFVRFSL
jgi:hypothetical protein